jgi:hypothetical protein
VEQAVLTRPYGPDADQSCAQCGSKTPVEVMPLQLDMPSPMSDWFCNIPTRMADTLGAAKFQFETLARLVQYYKTRCGQQKAVMDRMRNEIKRVNELKRWAVVLQAYGNLDTDLG